MKLQCLFILACLHICLNSLPQQQALPEFGKISNAELSLTECPFEKNAPAFYLLNYTKTNFSLYMDGSTKMVTERRVRIKILNRQGFEYATVQIPHVGNRHASKITDLEAFIYAPGENGNIIKTRVEKKDIFKSTLSKENNLNVVKFTFPDLKPGCVIEYRYEHVENDSYSIEPWLFQNRIPVALSYCEMNLPAFSLLDYRLAGQLTLNADNYRAWTIDSTKDVYRKAFAMNNVPSFKMEPLMSSLVDNLKRIEFSFVPNPGFITRASSTASIDSKWKAVNARMNVSMEFGRQFSAPVPGTEHLVDSIKQLPLKKDRIDAVFHSVRNHVIWDKLQTMYPNDIAHAWETGTGNSADLNILVLNLLNKAGVESYPVLISTRDNGKTDPAFAHMSQFNGLDVLVLDSNNYYVLDASVKNQGWLLPPLNLINRDVLVIMPKEHKWVNIVESRHLIKDSVFVTASLNKDGSITGEAIVSSFNISRDIRLSDDAASGQDKEDLVAGDSPELKKDSSWMINRDNEMAPLIEHTKFHCTLNGTGNFLFLNPYLFSSMKKNPFTDSSRVTDIDFICNQQYLQTLKITIPPEISMETLPKSITIRTEDSAMIYSRTISQRGNALWMENGFIINRSNYAAEEYAGVREFFAKIYALLSEEVVLNRKD